MPPRIPRQPAAPLDRSCGLPPCAGGERAPRPTRAPYNGAMTPGDSYVLRPHDCPRLDGAILVLASGGWMAAGDVSAGTVRRRVDLLGARPVAEIDPVPSYSYNFPGSMEVAALFRPAVKSEDGR